MTTPWRKAWRDVWRERTRTALVVAAIALGIAGTSTVLSTYAVLVRELDRGYLATNPASANLWTDAVDDALLRAVRAHPGVGDAEARRAVRGRIRTGPMEWRNLVLFVVADYGDVRVSRLVPERGAWPPSAGEVLIERDALQVARAEIGDTVAVRTAEGRDGTLRVAGSVHDVGQAQARMENLVYGYVTLETLARLGETPYLDELKLLVAENQLDEPHVRRVAAEVERLVEGLGHPVSGVEVPRPGKHPHADLTGLLLLSLSSFGGFVLLLSGILVVNLLTALMAAQVRQIGVMQAVGGTRGRIARIYLAQALLLGAAAVLVGLPLGIWGSRVFCRAMAGFLNFDITSFAAPAWVYLSAAAVGLVVPLLAAAYPVWKGSGVPVREALGDFGVARSAFGTSAFDRALAGVGGAARPLLLALRNGFRRRTRLVLTVATLAAGGLFFMAALNVRASLIETLDRLFAQRKYDLSVNLGTMVPLAAVERAVARTPGVERAEGWIVSDGTFPGGDEDGDFTVVALPAATGLLAPAIVAGVWLRPGEDDALVVNSAWATRWPRYEVGDTVAFRLGTELRSWRLVGIAREPFARPVAYVPRAFFEAYHPGAVNSLRLALARTDPAAVRRVEAVLERELEREGLRAQGSRSEADSRFGFDQHMVMIYVALLVMSAIIVGVGGLGLATTMSLNVLERRREMGVLRAIGATPRAVWGIVAAEGAVVGLLSGLVAALAAWPASKAIGDLLVGLMFQSAPDFRFELRGLLIWLAASVVLGAAASFLPAWHASRGSVREALAYE